ncbi:hypothetical protein V6N11_082018 [Hibiscus sabdariffa]|uniref:Uncharacterized protein n=2 Tax=Hibiscus sabdariffa TaxID=183260 RepID=A0ABR1Z9M2_9ROSI
MNGCPLLVLLHWFQNDLLHDVTSDGYELRCVGSLLLFISASDATRHLIDKPSSTFLLKLKHYQSLLMDQVQPADYHSMNEIATWRQFHSNKSSSGVKNITTIGTASSKRTKESSNKGCGKSCSKFYGE